MDRLDFDRDGAHWPNKAVSRFVDAAGFKWHVQILGDGPPMLLLHGTGASTHSWRHIVPLLSNHLTLIIPDLPGHAFTGEPPASAFTLPGMAAAVGQLLNALDVDPMFVAGHSAGSAVAIRMTLDRLIAPRAIFSINGAILPFQGLAGQFFSPLAKLLFLNPFIPRLFAWRAADKSAVRRLLADTGSRLNPDDIDLYAQLFSSPGHCAAALGMMARWDLDALQRDLPRLDTELFLIVGNNDRAIRPIDAERVSAIVQNSRVLKIADAGHLAHEEKANDVAAFILDASQQLATGHSPSQTP